jgi:hypothetical protein
LGPLLAAGSIEPGNATSLMVNFSPKNVSGLCLMHVTEG